MAREKTLIVMIGAFSPITHGIAVVNGAILAHLQTVGATTLVFNVSVPNLNRKFLLRMRRLPKVLTTIVRLTCMKGLRGVNFYMSISGGLGQIYEILFACVARIRGMKLHLHHHSFA